MMLLPVGPAHAGVLAALHAAAFPPADRWSEAAFRELILAAGVGGLVSAAGGFILYRRAADDADIVTLAVLPSCRRQGLGRALLAAALEHLRAADTARVFLEVAETNEPAIALYGASGFNRVGMRRGYYSDGGAAVLMRRDLATPFAPADAAGPPGRAVR